MSRHGVVWTSRAPAWIEPSDCLRSVAAVEAAYRSWQSGAWERVDTAFRIEPRHETVPYHDAVAPDAALGAAS